MQGIAFSVGIVLIGVGLIVAPFKLRNKANRQIVIPLGFLFGALIVLAGGMLVWSSASDMRLAAFNQQIDTYLKAVPAHRDVVDSPKIVGKLLPVNVSARKANHLVFDLPQAIRPAKPDEVGTVAQLEFSETQTGTYADGVNAYQSSCQVTLIEMRSWRHLGSFRVDGASPPLKRRSSASGKGGLPTDAVKRFLLNLPRE